jgi:hypothetical protein
MLEEFSSIQYIVFSTKMNNLNIKIRLWLNQMTKYITIKSWPKPTLQNDGKPQKDCSN